MLPKITKLTKSAMNRILNERLEDLDEDWWDDVIRKPNPHKQTFKPSTHKNDKYERNERQINRSMKEAFC